MKRTIIAPVLAVSLLVGSVASAQNALFNTPNVSAQVTFYKADPALGAAALTSTTVNNSPAAVNFSDVSAARYATVVYEGEAYTFALAESGKNKNEVVLELAKQTEGASLVSRSNTITLADLLSGLASDPELPEQLRGMSAVL